MSESPFIHGQPVSAIVRSVPGTLENLRRQPKVKKHTLPTRAARKVRRSAETPPREGK